MTAVELVTAAIDRIEALNPTLNAVITPVFGATLAADEARWVGPRLPGASAGTTT